MSPVSSVGIDPIGCTIQGFNALPISVAVRSKASVCGLSLAGVAGSDPAGGHDVL